MPIERAIPLAILALASGACLVFGAQWLVAVMHRSRASFAIERADAGQRANVAGLRFGVALACTLASAALAVAAGSASSPNGTSSPATDAAGRVIYYVTMTPARAAESTAAVGLPVGLIAPPTAPSPPVATVGPPTATASSTLTSGPISGPSPTPTQRATVAPTATASSTRPPGPAPTQRAVTPTPTATPSRAASLPAPDCIDPGTVGILSPAHGETVSAPRAIIVNAGVLAGEFVKFEVLNDAGTWAFLGRTDVGIRNGPIGQFDPAQFPPGPRQIRLMLVDRDQREAKQCRVTVIVP